MRTNHLESILKISEKTIMESNNHIPQLFLVGSQGKIMAILAELPENSEAKHKLLFMAGYKMGVDPKANEALGELQELFFVSEAWVSIIPKGQQSTVQPRNDPEKKEYLIVSIKNLKKNTDSLVMREIIRNKEGKVVKLENDKTSGEVKSFIIDQFIAGFQAGQKEYYSQYN